MRTNEIVLNKPTLQNVTLTDSEWEEITFSDAKIKVILIQAREKEEILLSLDKNQTKYWSIKQGATMAIASSFSSTDSDENLKFWIKTASPPTTIEIMEGR